MDRTDHRGTNRLLYRISHIRSGVKGTSMMEEVTGKDNFEVVEWTIANFSCWNADVHGEVIKSQEFRGVLGVSLKLELRPKGGGGESLLASVICNEPVDLRGFLSFISSHGSILSSCKQSLFSSLLYFRGPRFDEVVAQIRKNEAQHEDKLILKLRMRFKYNKVMLARTEIATTCSSWKISSPTLKNLTSGYNWISRTFYKLDDDSMGEMDLIAFRLDSEIKFQLDHESPFLRNVLVFVYVSILGKDGAVSETTEKEHMFLERENWMFWNSALTKEIEDDFSLILRVKIVPSVKYKHQSGYNMPTFIAKHCLVDPSYHESRN